MAFTHWLSDVFELQDKRHARLLPMEGLRGLAVTLVFLQHYSVQAQLTGLDAGPAQAFADAFRTYGNLGVELFFVMSGYLIYGTLIRKSPPFLAFMARRLQRIYPAFFVVFVAALALTILLPIPGKIPAGSGAAALYLAANAGLLAGLVPMVRIVDVAWSLSYEMFFYLVTAACVLGLNLPAVPRLRRIAMLAATTVVFIALCYARIPEWPERMMPFFAGMLLAEGVGGRMPAWVAWAALLVSFLASLSHAFSTVTGEFIHTVAFFAVCAVCFRGSGSISALMTVTPLRWLGNMSYSYYLVHGFVVRAGMVVLARMLPHGMPEWLFWLFMPILFGVTLVASAVLFIAVEKPLSLRPQTVAGGVAAAGAQP